MTPDRPQDPNDGRLKPDAERPQATFVRGAALTPKDKLVTWLDAQKRGTEPRLLKLPLVLAKRGIGFDISKARLGGAADAVEVFADDTALGVGLADRAASECAGKPTCAFWVEAYWGSKLAPPGPSIRVMRIVSTIAPDQLAAADHAEVEGESGN